MAFLQWSSPRRLPKDRSSGPSQTPAWATPGSHLSLHGFSAQTAERSSRLGHTPELLFALLSLGILLLSVTLMAQQTRQIHRKRKWRREMEALVMQLAEVVLLEQDVAVRLTEAAQSLHLSLKPWSYRPQHHTQTHRGATAT